MRRLIDCNSVRALRLPHRACRGADADPAADHGAAALRPAADPAAHDLARSAHRLGGEEPLPAVPPRGRFPAPCRGAKHQERARGRAADGERDRRARLGARHARQSLRRCRWATVMTPASATARASPISRPPTIASRCGCIGAPPQSDLRLDVRRRRRRAAQLHRRVRRGGAHPPRLRQAHHRDGRRRGAERRRRSARPPRSRCATC